MTAEEKLKKIENFINERIEDNKKRQNYNLSLYAGEYHALMTIKSMFFEEEE
jgi:hypothetical protein